MVEGTIENLEAVQRFTSAELEKLGAPARTVQRLLLAVEELYTNVVKYAFEDQAEKPVSVTVEGSAGLVRVRLCDQGKPFDPLDFPAPDISLDLDHKQPGRLGIHLVRKLIERVSYARENDSNCIILESTVP